MDTEPSRPPQVYYSVAVPKNRVKVERRNSDKQTKVFDLFALKRNAADNSTGSNTDRVKIDEPLEDPLESRLVLEPHESRTFVVYFTPKHAGVFNGEFSFVISGSTESSYRVKATGTGDVPRLNMEPSCIFKKVT